MVESNVKEADFGDIINTPTDIIR